MAQVIKVLAQHHEVSIVFPSNDSVELPHYISKSFVLPKLGSQKNTFSALPKLGTDILGLHEQRLSEFLEQIDADFIYWTHSYLPAGVPVLFKRNAGKSIVEFANIEGQRFGSMAKVATLKPRIKLLLESVKAKFWEPKIAKSAFVSVALSSNDADQLKKWGANVLLAPNGVDYTPMDSVGPSGYLLIFASMNYAPNVAATLSFVNNIWPKISKVHSNLELVIAGRSASKLEFGPTQNVRIISDPISQDPIYQGAIATVIPTNSGGGSQLKITESLQRKRLCLISPYTLRTAPAEIVEFLGDYIFHDARTCLELIDQVLVESARQKLENDIAENISELSWDKTMHDVLDTLEH